MIDNAMNILIAFLMGFVSGCLVIHTVLMYIDREELNESEEGTSENNKGN